MASDKTMELDRASVDILAHVGQVLGTDRAYSFHFRGARLANTHEWVRDNGTKPFVNELGYIEAADLPFFSRILREEQRPIIVREPREDLDAVAAKLEIAEMERENIVQAALVPIPSHGDPKSETVGGFVGVDVCHSTAGKQAALGASNEVVQALSEVGTFLFQLQSLAELVHGVVPVPHERGQDATIAAPSAYYISRALESILASLKRHKALFDKFQSHIVAMMPPPGELPRPPLIPRLRLAVACR